LAETNWILNLIDRVTGTAKTIASNVMAGVKAITAMDSSAKLSQKELEKMLKEEQQHRKQLIAQIKEQEKVVSDYEKKRDKAAPGHARQAAITALNNEKQALQNLKQELELSNEALQDHKTQIEQVKNESQKWVNTALGFNQVSEILGKIAKTFDFATTIARSRDNIQRMTGATGKALDEVTGKVHNIARSFDESDDKIALAANALSKNMGVSYNEALALIEKGYDKGANLQGDMLQMLERYAPQLQQMGLSASESIALMAQAGKSGIPVDKAVDSLKQANDALRERGPATEEALKGIGISVEELSKKTSFEAVQMISKSMEGASEAAKAKVLKSIFKESGKSAGSGFVEGIASVDMNIDNIPSVVEAGTGFKKLLADLESWFGNTFGNAGIYIQQFAGVAGSLNDVIGIFATLNKMTWAQNIAQKALNVTTGIFSAIAAAGPWGWIAIAIGAVITVVGLLADKFEWAAGIVGGVKNSFMDFGMVLLDIILTPVKLILSTLGAIGSAIAKLFSGDFSGAWQAAKTAIDPVKDLIADTKKAANSYQQGSDDAKEEYRKKQQEEANTTAGTGPEYTPPPLGTPPDDKKNSKGKSDGMSISGAGGTKSITMNLEIKNYFNNVKGNVRDLANQVAGQINDRLRDALVAQ